MAFDTSLYFDIENYQMPIIYSHKYNVSFLGLEKLFPLDTKKWRNIFNILQQYKLVSHKTIVVPNEVTEKDLLEVHGKSYLRKLKYSFYVAIVEEMPLLCFVPNFIIQKKILKPMRYQTGGTILAGKLALDRGWAINLGGGFHHCSANKGGGFCAYADITLLIRFLLNYYPHRVKKVMIVDLDAHQGNGHERDFKANSNVYIMDVYNKNIYPFDRKAKEAIRRKVEIDYYTEDFMYLPLIKKHLKLSIKEFLPDVMVYNAGTDILEGDSLGSLSISPEGIVKRDEIVFRYARTKNIPIVMLTSGGYRKQTAKIIADSILNLHNQGLLLNHNMNTT